ncbi:hypothetical protein SCB71_00845 [Herbiconiux sp. KACC 21604]|uniref:hypothetical protein n=1 Tax=unclassified Herbiconiux TaxID=2618217 RepID=UPI00149324C9|nr:hypothetical protein [Herbiconiux sp. SALV-R1]QJU55618.1 hypothetical protein HL652_19700 [Herbiconiux sp. SALV-R1]WPO86814.1 hypothetical protein SCB71_00845 [Herbiconiux sp. KACC 21604]
MQTLSTPVDVGPLTERVSRREVRRSWRALVAEHPEARDTTGTIRRVMLGVPTVAVAIVALVLAGILVAEVVRGETQVSTAVIVQASLGGVLALTCVLTGTTWLRLLRRRRRPRVHHRLMRFAAANSMSYQPGPTGAERGSPLKARGGLNLTRVLRTAGERAIEFANYELAAPTSTSTSPPFGGYAALRLPAPLPNILLRSEDGPRRSLLTPAALRGSQVLSLEGDFDRFFRLYCPEGYERDALYLFTPDVMARLVDHLRGLDVEIIDDWMYLVSSRDLVTDRADRWLALTAAVDALDDRVERWGRWRDERAAGAAGAGAAGAASAGGVGQPPVRVRQVAKQGRRLRTIWSPGTIAITSATALCFAGLVVAVALH